MVTARTILQALLLSYLLTSVAAYSDVRDPLDPFDQPPALSQEDSSDNNKTAEELVQEAELLLDDERPLDARTKLLKALEKNPKYYQAHLILAGYYIRYVGHYKLALKYIKQAQALFEEINGQPPYEDSLVRAHHAHILYLLSQARLNLDNYPGALETLDQYASYGYFQNWYPGTRSWVLMKLGKIDEAIKVARIGVLTGAEPGRTLNMLGILLSMTDQRQESLRVFDQAIHYELSLGNLGQPATPLNNSGEVYKEIFDEPRAETAWHQAIAMPDGCEHVLPSLNLALLQIDQFELSIAKKAMDDFESCVAQFPLRNGEEHRALVHLARGRIDLHSGLIDRAIDHLEGAIDRRQWFGKIGTSEDDLHSAAMISLAQALIAKNNLENLRAHEGLLDWAEAIPERLERSLRSAWLMRRARQVLTEDLSNFEDIYVRHTDSMIEYPTLGQVIAGMPYTTAQERIELEEKSDNRDEAKPYYLAYQAESNLESWGGEQAGLQEIEQALKLARPEHDQLLIAHLLTLKLGLEDRFSPTYVSIAKRILALNRPTLRNAGFPIPVQLSSGAEAISGELSGTVFEPNNGGNVVANIDYSNSGTEHQISISGPEFTFKASGKTIAETINRLSDMVFSEELP